MTNLRKNKLIELTPEIWGVVEYLGETGLLDINDAKVAIKEVAIKRMDFAEYWLNLAKSLSSNNISDRNVLGRVYYGMYHAARAAVYIQTRLDVPEHRALVKQFKKVLKKKYNDETLGEHLNNWRVIRIDCDYNPFIEISKELCNKAIADGESIINICKNLIEEL